MCCLGWAYELAGSLFILLIPVFNILEITNANFPDAILMFILVPYVYLLNDEETKTIIVQESWYQGIRYMLGIHTQVAPQNQDVNQNSNPTEKDDSVAEYW